MHIYDFISKEQLADLPEDGRLAFAEVVRISDQVLLERTRGLDFQEGWQELNDWRYSFLNVIVGAANQFGIDSISSLHVDSIDVFDDKSYRSARADLDRFTTQIAIESALKERKSVINIPDGARDRIKSYIHHLRSEVEKSDFPEARKVSLLDALSKFEQELDKRRISIASVALIALAVMSAPDGLWSSAKLVNEVVINILQIFGEAKEAEDAGRLASSKQIVELPPPHPRPKPQTQNASLDDDIPF